MKRDGMFKQSRWVECMEEETKVRKNLSRLINTVKHIPTDRCRKDTSSLWNWVGELESFQPQDTVRSENHSEKATRKSFSKKYLDLRLYPSRGRSTSPDSTLKNQKQEKKPHTLNSNVSKKNKKVESNKTEMDNKLNSEPNTNSFQDRRPPNNTKSGRNRNCKENVLPENDRNKKSSERESSSEIKGSRSKLRGKFNSFQSRRKKGDTNILKQNKSSERLLKEKMSSCLSQEPSLLGSDKPHKYKVLDKIKGLKNGDYVKNKPDPPKPLNATLGEAFRQKNLLEKEQKSMVKTLTSYWNNLLSKEVDDNELSSSSDSCDGPPINKSLHDLARSIYHTTRNRRRRINLSNHRSESSVDIMKKLDRFNNSSHVLKNPKENKDAFFQRLSEVLSNGDVPSVNYKNGLRLKRELRSDIEATSTNQSLLEMCLDKSCGDNQSLQIIRKSEVQEGFNASFDFKAHHAIEVMEKLVRKLKRLSELSLMSDQLNLSHSLRTLLCLMTATVLSCEEQIVDDFLEPEDMVEIKGCANSPSSVELHHSSDIAELSDISLIPDRFNCSNERNDNLQLELVQGITTRKVEDALRYLTLCKDYLWTEFLFSPVLNEGPYSQVYYGCRQSPESYTFVIEEEILFEEDSDEDEYPFEDDSEDEREDEEYERTTEEVCMSMVDFILTTLEGLANLAADTIIRYWPDSFERFVGVMYQTLVSILVWWVIMKEIFCK